MIFDVKPAIDQTMQELDDLSQYQSLSEDLATHLRQFLVDCRDDHQTLSPMFGAPGDARRMATNRTSMTIDMSDMTSLSTATTNMAFREKKELAKYQDILLPP